MLIKERITLEDETILHRVTILLFLHSGALGQLIVNKARKR